MAIEVDFSENRVKDFKPLDTPPEAPVAKPLEQIFKPLVPKAAEAPKPEPPKTTETPPADVAKDTPAPKPLDNDQVAAYLKTLYPDRQFESLDDFVKPVEKVVNEFDDVMDAEDKAYLNYKRETGRTRKEFEFLNQDLSKLSPLDLAIERVRKDTGLKTLSKDKAIAYLENKLSIDLSGEAIDTVDDIELNGYAKPYLDALTIEKETYRTPLDNALKALPKEEYVELTNGEKMPKKQYDALIKTRHKYIEDVTKAVNSVTARNFNVAIDDNGEKRALEFKYDYSQEDKHSMLSDAKDIDATIAKRYKANDQFNHQGLAEAMWWGDEKNQQKVIAAAMQQARAELIEELAKRDNNENFLPRTLQTPKTTKEGYGQLTGRQSNNGFGVKIKI